MCFIGLHLGLGFELINVQSIESYFRDRRWPEHMIPLAERLGWDLDRVFAENARLNLTQAEWDEIFLQQLELRKEEEPQLTDEEFLGLVDAADFKAD